MTTRLIRLVPLAGVVFAVLEVVGNLSIGKFPDGDSPIAKLVANDSVHHAGIARGGFILHWAALFLAFFAAALWSRIRSSDVHPLIAGAALLGAAVTVAAEFAGAGVYSTLGFIGDKHTIAPATLQAVHTGAGGGPISGDGGLAILLLAIAAAGLAGHAFPRWLTWSALPLGLLQLTPVSYFAGVVFLLWAVAASIYMTVRPAPEANDTRHGSGLGPAGLDDPVHG